MNTTRWIGTGLITAALTAVVLAQAPAMNIRMGLWEITSNTKLGGQMPGVDTSQMTPEQKARVEAAMQSAMQGMQGTHVSKSCVKREDFDLTKLIGNNDDQNCKQTIKTNTTTVLDGSVTCTGDRPTSSQMHVVATSPTTFNGTIKSTTSENGKAMTVDMTMTGKWVSTDCGSLK